VNPRSYSPTTTASNLRPGLRAAASSAAARGRRSHVTSRDHPTSTNSSTISPCPAITDSATSRCQACDETGSWNPSVDVRP
jgi:hypothetical protein